VQAAAHDLRRRFDAINRLLHLPKEECPPGAGVHNASAELGAALVRPGDLVMRFYLSGLQLAIDDEEEPVRLYEGFVTVLAREIKPALASINSCLDTRPKKNPGGLVPTRLNPANSCPEFVIILRNLLPVPRIGQMRAGTLPSIKIHPARWP
jgi:hypothetical protein